MNSESKLEIRLKYEAYCYSNAIKNKIQKCIISNTMQTVASEVLI